jgi:hypothetical protein
MNTHTVTTPRKLTALLSLAFVSLLTANHINAATLTYDNGWNYNVPLLGVSLSGANYYASTTDLANAGQSTLLNTVWSGGSSGESDSSPAQLNNGLYAPAYSPDPSYVDAALTTSTLLGTQDTTYTINFNGGMDITSIDIYAAMTGTTRAKQNWNLEYRLAGNSFYTDLGVIVAQDSNGNRQGAYYNKITLTPGSGELLNVDSLRFMFLEPMYNPATDGPNSTMNSTGYREIDVFGTAAIPEPSTYAMLLGGLATLFLIRRRVQA